MKINELLKKRPTLSFEIFPPKNNENDITSIYATIDELAKMNPDFISVTYGANGSTSKNTCKIASTIKNKYGIESVAHLTCMNNTKDEIKEILEELKENGIENVLSLRGDYPKDGDGINHGDFKYASELNEFIEENFPNDFCLSGGCYPETHYEAKNFEEDLLNLKKKVDAGAKYLVTQIFYDNQYYYRLVREARKIGIHIPILAGIMPAHNPKQLKNIAKMSNCSVPFLDDIVKGMFNQAIEMTINRCTTHGKHDEVDVDAVLDFVAKNYMLLAEIDAKNKDVVKNDSKKLLETLTEICFSQYQMRLNKDIDHAKIVNYERSVLLGVIDYTWINHIDAMTKLRNGIYLRAYAQKNPLSEYTEEAFYMFEQMKLSIVDMISKNIVHMGIRPGSSAEENIPHLKLEVEFK